MKGNVLIENPVVERGRIDLITEHQSDVQNLDELELSPAEMEDISWRKGYPSKRRSKNSGMNHHLST